MRNLIPLSLLLGLVACGGGEDSYADGGNADIEQIEEVLTDEAAAAEAEAEITADNADEEFEKLKAAIEADDGDF